LINIIKDFMVFPLEVYAEKFLRYTWRYQDYGDVIIYVIINIV
jgi:hypothetical protein